jgi:hypothetical protein
MLGAPLAGVGGIDTDDRDAAAGGHGGQAGAEARRGDTSHGAPEPFPTLAAAHRVTAGGAGIGEIEVLDDHRRASGVTRSIE